MSGVVLAKRPMWFQLLWVRRCGSLILYALMACVFMGGVILHPTTIYVGQPGDAEQSMWYLGWFWHALLHGENPLLSIAINHLSGINLMSNTSIIAQAALFGPLSFLFNLVFVYNTIFFFNMVITGFLAERVFHQLGITRWLAVLGGLLVSVLPYYDAQNLAHLPLIITSPIFAVIYLLIKLVRKRSARPIMTGTAIGLLLAMEFYTSMELFVTAAMLGAITMGCSFVMFRQTLKRFIRRTSKSLIVAGVVAVIVMMPGVLELSLGPYHFSNHGWVHGPNTYVTDLVSLVVPSPVYLLHDQMTTAISQSFTGNYSESDGYIGIPALILFIWATRRTWQRPLTRLVCLVVIIGTILSFGPFLHILGRTSNVALPWLLVQFLPIAKDILPSRLMLYPELCIVLILLLAFDDLRRTEKGKVTLFVPLLATMLVCLTWFPSLPFASTAIPLKLVQGLRKTGSLHAILHGQPSAILSANFAENMEQLADSGYDFPVTNMYGFAQHEPAGLTALNKELFDTSAPLTSHQMTTDIRALLPHLDVSRLVFLPSSGARTIPPSLFKAVTSILGQPVAQTTGAFVWQVPQKIE